jgi:hypothetical protein
MLAEYFRSTGNFDYNLKTVENLKTLKVIEKTESSHLKGKSMSS